MSVFQRLLFVFMATVVMLFAPAIARADDEHPKEGIDYFVTRGPKEGSTYYRLREGANVYSTNLFKSLGTDMDSFREDNKSMTIPLCCKNAEQRLGCQSPNQSKHESDAAWQGCSAEKRYLYVLPGTRFEISGMKSISFDQKMAMATEMMRCRGKAECINGVLSSVGIEPKYGTGSAPATTSSPATPDPKTGSATPAPAPQGECDQKCLLDKLTATGWKAPAPIEKIVETQRKLTFSEAYGIWFAGGIGIAALALTIFLAYLIRSHRSEREEQAKELNQARENFVERDRELNKFRNWLKEANVANKAFTTFLKEVLAKDLGVRLESDADATGLDARANLIIKAFESNAQLRLARLISALEHLGVTVKHLADKSFADVFDGICRRASAVNSDLIKAHDEAKSARDELAASVERYSENVSRMKATHQKELDGLNYDHAAALSELRRAQEDEIARLKEFIGIKEDAEQLKIAYDAYAAVKNGLAAKKAELAKRLPPREEQDAKSEASQGLQESSSGELILNEGARNYDSAVLILGTFRERVIAALQTDIGDLTTELESCTATYQRWLNQMEIHLGIPLSHATAEAMANDALNDAGQKLAEAIALREDNLKREQELVNLAKEIKDQEGALIARDRELDNRVTDAVDQAVNTVKAQLEAKTEELEALHRAHDELHAQHNEMLSGVLQAPPMPNLNGKNTNGNGNGVHVYEHRSTTKTMPLSLGEQGASSPFDDLLQPLQQFNIDAGIVLRPRLSLVHITALHTFLSWKYELGSDVLKRIDDRTRASNGGTRPSSQEDVLAALYDATLGEVYQLLKNLPFLLSASGGVNGRNSAAPSPTG